MLAVGAPYRDAVATERPSAQLGPCRLGTVLGSGGMGTVHAAVLMRDAVGLPAGARVAVKVLHPHLFGTEVFLERFEREARVGLAVKHPNVVRTLGCAKVMVDDEPRCFIIMEHVEGQTLRELLTELERVPEDLCLHVAREICAGLEAIHGVGAVHRDLKPENVLITPDHQVKIMDLGVARLVDEVVRLSQSGAFVGSVHYAAPEQIEAGGRIVDGRVDLHALGLLLYELSSGVHPFLAADVAEILRRVLHERPRRLGELNPQLSPFFEEVVDTLMSKDRRQRFASARELGDVLAGGERAQWWRNRAREIRAATHRPLRRIRIPRETAVYGRDAQLDILRAQFARAAAGDGQVVLIEGEAGIGKSRLVDELVRRLHTDGEDLDFLFGGYPPGGAATVQGAFSTAFREHFGSAGSAAYLPQTPLLVDAFDAVLRGEPAPPGSIALTNDSLSTCFVHATRNLAAERPIVILIDDLQFAPGEARALFTALALAAPGHRVLLIGTMRPGVPQEWRSHVTTLPHAAHVSLGRLGPKDLAELLRDAFRSEQLATDLGHRIALKSDGNPFFVFEIVRGLREGRFITQSLDGSWSSTGAIQEIRIPSSVLDLVNARVAELSEEQRDLLDVATCCGFEFDPGLVARAAGLPRVVCLKRLAQIERKHRLVRSAGRRFLFDHHQVQEALYGVLPVMLREEYHGALAVALEQELSALEHEPEELDGERCVELCEHFLEGARADAARRYLAPALDHLERGHLNEQVVELAERALAAPGMVEGEERVALLLRLAGPNSPLDMMGRRVRQRSVCEEAIELARQAPDAGLQAKARMALGVCLTRRSQNAEAEVVFRRALELAESGGDAETLASVRGNLGVALFMQGKLDEAREQFEREIDLSRGIGYAQGEASATGNLGIVLAALGREKEAQRYRVATLELHRRLGDRRGEAIATGNLGTTPYSQGRLREAHEIYLRHLALCREVGYRQGQVVGMCNLGNVLFAQGRSAEGLKSYEHMLTLSREIGYPYGEAVALHSIGTSRIGMGDAEGGVAQLRACRELCDRLGHVNVLPASCGIAIGAQLATAGDFAEARAELEFALAFAVNNHLPDQEMEARCRLALLPGGDAGQALDALATEGDALSANAACRVYRLLWHVTGDTAHLAEARRRLDAILAHVDAEARDTMIAKVADYRDIIAESRRIHAGGAPD